GQFKVGRRLSVKILNASKFVLGLGPVAEDAAITDPIDLPMLAGLASVVTEEVWSWWQEGSVHRAPWPTVDELPMAPEGDPALLSAVAAVLQQVRKAKPVAQISMRAPVDRVEVQGAEAALVGRAETDLKAAGVISELVLGSSEKDELTVDVTLG